MEAATVVLRNKGTRTYRLQDGPGGVRRELEPHRTLAVTEAEAVQYKNYHDIEDAAEAVPQNQLVINQLMEENKRLRAERADLMSRGVPVGDVPPVPQAPVVVPPVVAEQPAPKAAPAPKVVKVRRKGA